MNPSNDTSRDDTLDPSQEDGVRPVSTEADPMTADAPGTRPNELPRATGQRIDTSPPAPASSAQDPAVGAASSADRAPRLTRASAAWASIVGALLLSVVLIVFVLQNPTTVVIHFLGWSGSLAVGMAMLIAAVTGGLLVARIGVARLTQLRVRANRTRAVPR